MRLSNLIVWPSDLLEDPKLRKVARAIDTFYREIRDVVNGRIELSRLVAGELFEENMGYPLVGETNAVAGDPTVVPHKLGRKPVNFWVMVDHAIGTTPTTLYWTPADYISWTELEITFRCTGSAIGYRGWVI